MYIKIAINFLKIIFILKKFEFFPDLKGIIFDLFDLFGISLFSYSLSEDKSSFFL